MTLALPCRRKPYVIAHRGDRTHCPENTLPAFVRAFQDGADMIETDLHLTKDNEIVCIHDFTVDRTTNGTGKVRDLSLNQIRVLNAAHHWPAYGAVTVPTLSETLACIPPGCGLALELKSPFLARPAAIRQMRKIIENYQLQHRTVFLSFSLSTLRRCKRYAPDIPCGLISLFRFFPGTKMELMGPVWPLIFLNPFFTLAAHAKGQLVCPLDSDPDSRLWFYRFLDCDAVLSDNPGKTVQKLRGR